ncbi:uncharacterized protein PHALS_06337 [Plasmopara halstedii]|uniref:Uncharacterized protein n=1 Tax=Plasmopara halstedii TaxID=4781 RepID=A0A0P1B199_PLAHL|nr:uncharacterized protein PHALS_06337 [Plasmopara halstedii]CEG48518.1 hypothetical protein PHALS_06337 [Plasmopara halstedii]|eukprot:XP_024584887.1 hypothetical protein PHALS_06337 [Plasmopara halstedii]
MSPVSMTPKSPSLAGSGGEHGQSPTSSPALGATSDNASAAPRGVYHRLDKHKRRAPRTPSAQSGLVEDVVGNESDTPFPAWDDEEGELHQRHDMNPARILRIPCPFPDFSSTEAHGVITNDWEHGRQLEAAHKAALNRAHPRSVIDPRVEYDFHPADPALETKDAVTRSLRVHINGSPARTDDEVATRKALRARFLVPQEIPLDVYRTRPSAQRGGSRVPTMRTIPVVLAPNESTTDDEALFERWV